MPKTPEFDEEEVFIEFTQGLLINDDQFEALKYVLEKEIPRAFVNGYSLDDNLLLTSFCTDIFDSLNPYIDNKFGSFNLSDLDYTREGVKSILKITFYHDEPKVTKNSISWIWVDIRVNI